MSADDCFWSIRFKDEARHRAPAKFALFYGSASADPSWLAEQVLQGNRGDVRWFNKSKFVEMAFRDWLKSYGDQLPEYDEKPFFADYPSPPGQQSRVEEDFAPPPIPFRFRGEVRKH